MGGCVSMGRMLPWGGGRGGRGVPPSPPVHWIRECLRSTGTQRLAGGMM